MFCGNCGTQIPEGSKFCPNCGTAVEAPVQAVPVETKVAEPVKASVQPAPQTPVQVQYQAVRKKGGAGKLVGIIAGVCVLILALGVGAAFLFLGRKTTINLNKYMTISYSGYETIGKASAAFDTEKFEADYKDKMQLYMYPPKKEAARCIELLPVKRTIKKYKISLVDRFVCRPFLCG